MMRLALGAKCVAPSAPRFVAAEPAANARSFDSISASAMPPRPMPKRLRNWRRLPKLNGSASIGSSESSLASTLQSCDEPLPRLQAALHLRAFCQQGEFQFRQGRAARRLLVDSALQDKDFNLAPAVDPHLGQPETAIN